MFFLISGQSSKTCDFAQTVCETARFWKKSPSRFFFCAYILLFYSCLQKITSRRNDAVFCAISHTGCFSLTQIWIGKD
jgi:hypothetical protein